MKKTITSYWYIATVQNQRIGSPADIYIYICGNVYK